MTCDLENGKYTSPCYIACVELSSIWMNFSVRSRFLLNCFSTYFSINLVVGGEHTCASNARCPTLLLPAQEQCVKLPSGACRKTPAVAVYQPFFAPFMVAVATLPPYSRVEHHRFPFGFVTIAFSALLPHRSAWSRCIFNRLWIFFIPNLQSF